MWSPVLPYVCKSLQCAVPTHKTGEQGELICVRALVCVCVSGVSCWWQAFLVAAWCVPSVRPRATLLPQPPSSHLQGAGPQNPGLPSAQEPSWGHQPRQAPPGLSGAGRGLGGAPGSPGSPGRALAMNPVRARAQGALRSGRAACRPGDLTRPRVSAGIPAPALNMPVIFISLRQAAKAIPPVAEAAATQCFPLVGRGNGGRPDFLITWC